eukprot:1466180-Lingulodinium_polyedra.AAC.1
MDSRFSFLVTWQMVDSNGASFSYSLCPQAQVRFHFIAVCPPVARTPKTEQKRLTRDGILAGSRSFS